MRPQISQVAPGNKREETSPATTLRCWIVTDGKVGMENQCLGLAEAMGLTPEVKRIRLRAALAGLPAEIWDGTGDNPYFGYLGLADAVIVTSDSVNMVTEAAATGKPVHVVDLEGGSAKFAAFHAVMREAGVVRPFAGRIEHWDHPPLLETGRVAAMVWERYRARH